jgi:hypothetical protein
VNPDQIPAPPAISAFIQATISALINSLFATNRFLAFSLLASTPVGLGNTIGSASASPSPLIMSMISS